MAPKLLYTASTYSHIVQFHLPYLAYFREMGWEVHVACGGAAMDIPYAHRVVDMPFAKRLTAPENFRCARRLGRLMSQEGYGLVITHTALAAFFTRLPLLGRRERPKVINTVHGYLFDRDTPAPKRQILLAAEKLTAPCTDLVLVMNRMDEELAEEHHLGKAVGFIPGMGVPFARLDRATDAQGRGCRRELGLPEDAFLMICVAEFSPRKNQAFLIRALEKLPPRAMLLLPGQGAERENCQALAAERGLQHRVFFPGQVADPSPYYRAADCAVTSSRIEGLPFGIMEAMYGALPVVASDVKGHRDLLEGGGGRLYPYGDEGAFLAAVGELLDSPGYAMEMGLTAARQVAQYDLEAVFPQVAVAYGALIPIPQEEALPRV